MFGNAKRCLLAAMMLVGAGLLAAPASADDLFGASSALDTSQLGGVSVGYSQINLNQVNGNASVEDNVVVGSDVKTGKIADNFVGFNRGVTTVLSNTGNFVSVNSSMIFNIYLD